MIPHPLKSIFDDTQRGDDRQPVTSRGVSNAKPPILRRRTIRLAALAGIAVVLYGTLVPFQVDPHAALSWHLQLHPPVPEDVVANVLIYIPIGACLRLLVRRRGSWRAAEGAAVLLTAGAISYLTEVGQTVIALRVPSWTDLICNLCGAAAGIVLAPPLQRALRNWHGWLHRAVRTAPLSALATAILVAIGVHALAPFDIHPTPGHITRALHALQASRDGLTADVDYWTYGSIGGPAMLNKLAAAGSYGLLAFLLVLAAQEAGRSRTRAMWHGLTRSVALVTAVEVLQLFTLSHVADWRDAILAWCCCGLGTMAAASLSSRIVGIHRRPAMVLRGVVVMVAIVLSVWTISAAAMADATVGRSTPSSWLPIVNNFYRSWTGLLGDYATGFVQCGLTAGLLALWFRSHHRVPRAAWIIGSGVLTAIVIRVGLAAIRGGAVDTGQILIGVVAGVLVIRADHAIWGSVPERTPHPPLPVPF